MEAAVPKFFFDLVDDTTIFDKKGVSLPNEKEARRYAITFARELMQTQPELLGESWQEWQVLMQCAANGDFTLTRGRRPGRRRPRHRARAVLKRTFLT